MIQDILSGKNLIWKSASRLHCERHKRSRQKVLKLNHQLKYQYQRLAINISININSLWKKRRRWCLKMFWSYFQFENADVDSQCATGPMSGDAHQRSGPTICMAGGQGGELKMHNSICNLYTIYMAGRRPREVEKMKLMHHSIAIYIQCVWQEDRGGGGQRWGEGFSL